MIRTPNNIVLLTNAHERSARGAWQSLKDAGIEVVLSTTTMGLRSLDQKRNITIHPCPITEVTDFKNWVLKNLDRDKNLVMLPINEAVMFACDRLRSERVDLATRFIMPSQSSLKYALSKFNTTQAAQEVSVLTPYTYFIKAPSSDVIDMPSEDLQYPLILKWDNVFYDGKYQKGSLRVVSNIIELEDSVAELAPLNCGIILQEMVPGHGVGGFFLRQNGRIILRFAHRRLHEVPWTGGVSAYCESSDDQEVLAEGERLLDAINYEGLAMVEFRKEVGKPPSFLEINGRLWGSLGLALRAGADFPRAMVEYHCHQKTVVEQPNLRKKVRWHEPGFDMMYLRSLCTEQSKQKNEKAPKLKGFTQVLLNFMNPIVGNDWMRLDEPITTSKKYLRLVKHQLSHLKNNVFFPQKENEIPLIVTEAVKRTQNIKQNPHEINTILFVCYGNICRSSFTEVRWESMRQIESKLPKSDSVGFHDKVNRPTPSRFQSVARHLGVNLSNHRSRRITKDLVDNADLLIAMDKRNLDDIRREFPEAIIKTILLGAIDNLKDPEIMDPYGQKIGVGGQIYRRLDIELNHLKNMILQK